MPLTGHKGGVIKSEELRELQHKVDSTTNESLESTRRMKHFLEESKEYGIRTLVELDDQGEKLENVEKGLTQVHDDMRQAKENLKGVGLLESILPQSWNKRGRRSSKEEAEKFKGNEDGKITVPNQGHRVSCPNVIATAGYIGKITGDSREDEMDANLGEVSSILANLKNMAIDIGSECDNQNNQIGHIIGMAETNKESVKVAVSKTQKLLSK